MAEIGGAEGMEKSEGRSSVRDSGNGAEVEWLFLWYRRMRRRWGGVAKAEKIAYSGGVGGYGSLRGIGRYRECGGVGGHGSLCGAVVADGAGSLRGIGGAVVADGAVTAFGL